MNQFFEQYLRHYVNETQNNWVELLLMTQLALNFKVSNTTKKTPFFANFEKEPNLFERELQHVSAQSAMERAKTFKEIHSNIVRMQQRFTVYQNSKRKTMPQLKEGDKIYLLTKNLKTKKASKKLDHVKVGSFFIKKQKGSVNYELNLPSNTKIHPIFHVSLLESADSETFIQNTFHFQYENDDEYEVERILAREGQKYLIRWKGYSTSKNTWEPIENLVNCQHLLRQFRRDQAKRQRISRNRQTAGIARKQRQKENQKGGL